VSLNVHLVCLFFLQVPAVPVDVILVLLVCIAIEAMLLRVLQHVLFVLLEVIPLVVAHANLVLLGNTSAIQVNLVPCVKRVLSTLTPLRTVLTAQWVNTLSKALRSAFHANLVDLPILLIPLVVHNALLVTSVFVPT